MATVDAQGPLKPRRTFFDDVGGHDFFATLTRGFYAGVREDELLLSLYPADELDDAEVRLRMFLEQYWGGPAAYSEQRGHPRLRMRHAPFLITTAARDAWLARMRAALDSMALDEAHDRALWDY